MTHPMHYFALLSEPRSGTTFFNSVIKTHPEVHSFGEILPGVARENQFHYFWRSKIEEDPKNLLLQRVPRLFEEYLDTYLPGLAPEANWLGLDIKYYQAQWKMDLLDLLAHRGCKAIHLIRRNILARHVSFSLHQPEIREQLQRSLHTSRTGQQVKISLPPGKTLLKQLADYQGYVNRYRTTLPRAFPYLELHFEDILDEESNGINRSSLDAIYDFLGIEHRVYDLGSTMKKLNPKRLRHSIANYHQVVETLLGTEYEWMLDDPQADADLIPAYEKLHDGEIQLMSGAANKALRSLEQARSLAPDLPDPVYLLGLVQLATGALPQGVETLQAGLAMTKGTPGHAYYDNLLNTTPMDAKTRKLVDVILK